MSFELLFYVVIGSGALIARFGKKNSVSNQQHHSYKVFVFFGFKFIFGDSW